MAIVRFAGGDRRHSRLRAEAVEVIVVVATQRGRRLPVIGKEIAEEIPGGSKVIGNRNSRGF